jgi:hypothetical protein
VVFENADIIYFFTKHAALMMKSTVLSLPLQQWFLDTDHLEWHILINLEIADHRVVYPDAPDQGMLKEGMAQYS